MLHRVGPLVTLNVSAGYYVTFHWANYGYKNGQVWGLTKKHRDTSLPLLERYVVTVLY